MADSKLMLTFMDINCCLQKAENGYKADSIFVTLYQSTIGSIIYIMLGTRPDIAYAVSVVSRYGSNPTPLHHRVVKRVFQYLKGTKNLQLIYKKDLRPLSGYTNSNWARDYNT